MFYGNRFAGWTSARSECSFIFIFCFKHLNFFHKFIPKKPIQAHTSIWCLLWSGLKERRKKLLQNLVDKNSGDLRRIVIYTLTLNKKCLGRFVWIADVFFKKYYRVGPPVLYPAKPSVHINKQTLFSLKVLIGLKLNISLCVSEGREKTNTSWVVRDRTGSGLESIKTSEWRPCERENTTSLQFRRDIEWRARSSFFCPADNDILISTCRVIDPAVGIRCSLSRLDHSGFHNTCFTTMRSNGLVCTGTIWGTGLFIFS